MTGINTKHVLELAAAEDEQSVEALATHAADPALGVCVRVRRLHGCADHGDPFALKDVVEAAAELRVAIVNQEAQRLLPIIECHQQVPCLLGRPGAGWVRRAGDELDPAALQRDEEEHVDPFQPSRLDGEEITGQRRRRLLAEKVSPGKLVSLRRRRKAAADEDRPHRSRRNGDAEALQFADDPFVAPMRVLTCESKNKRVHGAIERRPSRPSVRIGPAPPDQLAVPAKQRRRAHRQTRPGASRQRSSERREDCSIDGLKRRSSRLPAQDRQLMPEHQDLEFLRPL